MFGGILSQPSLSQLSKFLIQRKTQRGEVAGAKDGGIAVQVAAVQTTRTDAALMPCPWSDLLPRPAARSRAP